MWDHRYSIRIGVFFAAALIMTALGARHGRRGEASQSPRAALSRDERIAELLAKRNGWGGPEPLPTHGSSSGIAKSDFNGDGFADLAIGIPAEDTPASKRDSGAVIVIYGSANGLTTSAPGIPH